MPAAAKRRLVLVAAFVTLIAAGVIVGITTDLGVATVLLIEGGALLVVAAMIDISGRLRR
ncbi:hypothetical protein ADL21_00695 [Streptomyces albus subsp. albus]|nr:hypothetical protein ADL21_00695 [Streptomyces albus subsp. albus]